MNEPFAATVESIRRHAWRFEIAMWSFLAITSIGLGYALWKGLSFFPALRQALFQFAPLEQGDDVMHFAPFVNDVVATWPERLRDFQPNLFDASVTIGLVFLLEWLVFRLMRRLPRGKLLIETRPDNKQIQERAERALELAGVNRLLFERTDNGSEAGATDNVVYLPQEFTQKLDLKHLSNASEQLAFLIVHETTHSTTSDNVLWASGRSLALLLTALSVMCLAGPLLMALTTIFPAILVRTLPFLLSLSLVLLLGVFLLAFIGAVANAVLPNLTASREFFADAIAACSLGLQALPYDGYEEGSRRGDMVTAWSMTVPAPDRWLHARGIAPRTGALAAFTVAMWGIVRTAILMLAPMSRYGVVWVFDLACLGMIAVMVYSLPRHQISSRHYSFLPWMATLVLLGLVPLAFALTDKFFRLHGITSIISVSWLAVVTIPPFVIAVTALLWRRATAVLHITLEDIDRLRPRCVRIGPVIRLVSAVPSYVWSYTMGGVALVTWCTTLLTWSAGDGLFVFNVVCLPICIGIAILVAKNFTMPSYKTAAIEAIIGISVFALIVYMGGIMIRVSTLKPPENSGPLFDNDLLMQTLLSPPADVIAISSVASVGAGVILLVSWWARFRLFHFDPNSR